MSHILLEKWQEDPSLEDLRKKQERVHAQLVSGLEGSQRSFFAAALHSELQAPTLLLTRDMVTAEKLYEEMKGFLPGDEIFFFPGRDFFYAGEVLTQSKEILQQRIKVLEKLSLGKQVLVVAPATALLSKLPPAGIWKNKYVHLAQGSRIEWKGLLDQLVEIGYERVELTEGEGYFSARGDIVDIYPFHTNWPLRISFFDDEVESIRFYDPTSQRSLKTLSEVTIFPARELVIDEQARKRGAKKLTREMERVTSKLKASEMEEAADRLRTRVENHLLKLESSGYFEGIEQYISFFYDQPSALTDYFPSQGFLFWDEPENVATEAETILKELKDYQSDLMMQGDILPGQADVCWSLKEIFTNNHLKVIGLSTFSRRLPYVTVSNTVHIQARPSPSVAGKIELLKDELETWWKEGYEVFALYEGEKRKQQVKGLLENYELPVIEVRDRGHPFREMAGSEVGLELLEREPRSAPPAEAPQEKNRQAPGAVKLMEGRLENGFVLPHLQLAVVVDKDILPGQKKKKKAVPSSSKEKEKKPAPLRDFQEISVGDMVVHEQHGIGRYMGIRTLEVDGVNRDYLYIQYAGEDKLYLPVEQIEDLQKYIGGEGRPPKVYSLGGQEWNRVKNRVKASVQELARELLSLYAAREATSGYAFSSDHPWQKEFEDRFPYEETPDQLRAIQEVKEDMEKELPMDRILCGDVGYGKTEVALRAAFKAIMDGKQVAFLVPTTILAQQHYDNFVERFDNFPVEIELLSRFRNPQEQKKAIKKLKAGMADIVIGTHRLLSKDIKFKDLGLLIIDEEHRFGVRHKERLKMLRQEVDVLSMTATPIPRTLHMALSGARDLSVIDTPPENRYPIQTYVVEYSESMVREAIQRELNRGGQIFFVYNRVQTIEKCAAWLQDLVPEARMGVAHGQMREQKLEEVMHGFLKEEYDVLVSTTIVEAGLDIPNVNTMIVYDADHFGLAQLYQLRGRVGRSNRLAYCYLTYRKDKVITGDAVKRLQAVKEFTELGSGFKIAMRDLEIRGAGNILGPEQHGFMMDVGYELYCRLLEQAVETMKGEKKPEQAEQEISPKVDLNVNAYLPSAYIPNQQQKIELYRRIAALEDEEDLKDMEEELKDRFGKLQPPVENLLLVMRLRQLAKEKLVELIEQKNQQATIKFRQEKSFESDRLWQVVKSHRPALSLVHGGKGVSLRIKSPPRGQEKPLLEFLIQVLQEVS